jgi:hypothetical protein
MEFYRSNIRTHLFLLYFKRQSLKG